jgi:tetratricopeptide (TPR) repeat protein
MRRSRPLFLAVGILAAMSLSACAHIIVLEDPLTPEEHIRLGVAYEDKGELDAAVEHYEIAAKELPVAHLYLGNVYFLKKEPEKAEKHYLEALEKDPGNADAMNNLAWLYYTERKNLDTAAQLAKDALALEPSKSEIYMDTLLKIQSLIDSDCTVSSCR